MLGCRPEDVLPSPLCPDSPLMPICPSVLGSWGCGFHCSARALCEVGADKLGDITCPAGVWSVQKTVTGGLAFQVG